MTRTDFPTAGRAGNDRGPRPRSVLREARGDLWKAVLLALASVPLTVLAFQSGAWPRIRDDVVAAHGDGVTRTLLVVTPLDVLIVQAAVGLAVGVLLALPLGVYYGRGALAWWPREALGAKGQAMLVPVGVAAFLVGAVGGYGLWGRRFLDVLATYVSVGSTWPITRWGAVAAAFAVLCGLVAQVAAAVAVAGVTKRHTGRRR